MNGKSKLAGDKPPPEDVLLVANKSQVIEAMIPFNTKQAANIRRYMHENIVDNGQRIFIYRTNNGWTNISLESTEATPKLTADPTTTLITAWRAFTACPYVKNVTIKWKSSEDVIGFDDIGKMTFDDLPTSGEEPEAGTSKTDVEILHELLEDIQTKQNAMRSEVDECLTKILYMITVVDKTFKAVTADDLPDEPATVKSARKRKAPAK